MLKKILWTIGVLVWGYASITIASIIGAVIWHVLGFSLTEESTLPTLIFDAVVYILALVLAIGGTLVVRQALANRKRVLVGDKTEAKQASVPARRRIKRGSKVKAEVAQPEVVVQEKLEKPVASKDLATASLRTQLGLAGLPTWVDIVLAVVAFFAYLLVAQVVLTVFADLFPWFDVEQTQDTGFSTYLFGMDRIIAFVALVVVAPIAEELLFRGWMYGKLRTRWTGKVGAAVAIVLVSALFGFMHGQWNVGVNVFVLSVVLCLLREFTGTVYAGILLHMIKNGVAFYLLYVANYGA